jgi:hypothetical protein
MGGRYSLAFLILLLLKSRCPGALDVLPRECFGTSPYSHPNDRYPARPHLHDAHLLSGLTY